MKVSLSAEQRRVQEAYKLAFVDNFLVCLVVCVAAGLAIILILSELGFNTKSHFAPSLAVILVYWQVNLRTVRSLKSRGLSLAAQKTEVLTPAPSSEVAEIRQWYRRQSWLAWLAQEISFLLVSGGGYWMWRQPVVPFFDRICGILATTLCFYLAVNFLFFVLRPSVRMDVDGITAFQNFRIPRRALWRNIARCEVRSFRNYLGNESARFFDFQSAAGETILRVVFSPFSELSPQQQVEIEREIRHRFEASGSK